MIILMFNPLIHKINKILQKDYIFINSKKILSEYLEKDEKDIFYVDDTHWSYKASNILINNESFKKIFD